MSLSINLQGAAPCSIAFEEFSAIHNQERNILDIIIGYLTDLVCHTNKEEFRSLLNDLLTCEFKETADQKLLALKKLIALDSQGIISLNEKDGSHFLDVKTNTGTQSFELRKLRNSEAVIVSDNFREYDLLKQLIAGGKREEARDLLTQLKQCEGKTTEQCQEIFNKIKGCIKHGTHTSVFYSDPKNGVFTIGPCNINIAPWALANNSPADRAGFDHARFEQQWQKMEGFFSNESKEKAKAIMMHLNAQENLGEYEGISSEIFSEGFSLLRDMAKSEYRKCFENYNMMGHGNQYLIYDQAGEKLFEKNSGMFQ